MTDFLHKLRSVLGGEIQGGQLLCPGPGHSEFDRSLAVRPTPNGFVVHSFATDHWRDCAEYVRQRIGQPRWQPDRASKPRPSPDSRHSDRTRFAQRIWNEARDPRNTIAEQYLRSRRLILADDLCGSVLRFHPACPWEGKKVACLIAAFRAIGTDQIAAIHRIRVDRPIFWPKTQRKMLGAVAGSAIKLGAVGQTLCIGEGLETCLAARQLRLFDCASVWALGSAGNIEKFAPSDALKAVSRLAILGERDNGASVRAAQECRDLWNDVQTFLMLPGAAEAKDFNDQLMRAAHD